MPYPICSLVADGIGHGFFFSDHLKSTDLEIFINKILLFAIGGNPLPLGGGRSLVNL